ncbi:MAG TPA: ATP-binding protein [Syntrophorhabdaceae bacterium]|nr:ATP-binding protein [Syntrophorhabdaceae bacterium]HQM80754.1 ATP-binding protein [Syntrophorhabdaceae bacterium]
MNPVDLLGKIIEISHSNLELSSRITSILNIISRDMGSEEVIIYTRDKDRRLSCRYANQKSVLFKILNQYRCHVGEGIVGSVAQKRSPLFYTKRDIPPRFGCLFYPELDGRIENYKLFAFLPLADDSYLYGVLVLCSSSRDTLHDADKIFLSILSREVGGILCSYELIVSSKKRISELATLTELGKILTSNAEPHDLLRNISLIIAKSLNATFVTIKLGYAFLKLDSHRFTYGTIDPSVQDHVEELEGAATRLLRAVSIKDCAPDEYEDSFRYSLFSAPIVSKNRVLGTLTICGDRAGQNYALGEDGPYLINTIANYISSGMENTLLNTRLRDAIRELSDAQKRLIEQEKFRSLGEMTANIAHEIKNPLVIIGGFTKRLARQIDIDRTGNKYIRIILNEVTRLESILNEVLNYVKETPLIAETCNINDYIDEVLYLLTSDVSWEEIRVVKEYDAGLPLIACDSQQLKQVLINIFINAHEAMRGIGTIWIQTKQAAYENRPFVAISIADTGGGIDPAIIDNVFNPFFTTKERGTGLGLAISNKIVMNHKGHIDVENVAGKGVTFIIYLPAKNNTIKEELL